MASKRSITYRDAGVDIDAGDALVERIKPLAALTRRPEVVDDIGSFAAAFALNTRKYQNPLLVSSTDGVGTKLRLAFTLEKHDTVGIDLVGMVVNDLLATGAEPLFLLDYFACGKLNVDTAERVIAGIAEGCRQAGCSMIGGETAEMPGFYPDGEYDLAGFGVGIVERDHMIDGSSISVGAQLIGIGSTGVHSNGFSLVRKVLGEDKKSLAKKPRGLSATIGETLLVPTRIYVKSVLGLIRSGINVLGVAHITGGGLPENVPRILPAGVRAQVRAESWERPAIFNAIQAAGNVPDADMWRTFNMGIGMVVVVRADAANDTVDRLRGLGEQAWVIGDIQAHDGEPRCDVV